MVFLETKSEINPEKIKDKETFEKFNKVLPFETIKYIREHDFRGAFTADYVDVIDNFRELSKDPDFIFFDQELESYKVKLHDLTIEFSTLVGTNCFRLNIPGRDLYKIPQAHEFKDPDRWYVLTQQIDKLAEDIFNTYKELVQTAKKRL